ncbi:MAG: LysM domain-containing protein [Actinomycetota bacterium]
MRATNTRSDDLLRTNDRRRVVARRRVHHPASRQRCHRRRHAPAQVRRPRYAVRRAVAAAFLVLGLVGAAGAAEVAWSALAGPTTAGATSSDTPRSEVEIHVARPGDTLWSIADTHRGDVGQSSYVDALVRINGGAGIVAGQPVRLP